MLSSSYYIKTIRLKHLEREWGGGVVLPTNVQTHLRLGFGNYTRSIEAGGGSFSYSCLQYFHYALSYTTPSYGIHSSLFL